MRKRNFNTIFAAIFLTLMIALPAKSQLKQEESHILVAMRMIGHEVLMNSGDSLSRIMPIEKKGKRYKIPLESDFQFTPQNLVFTIDSVIKKSGISSNYIVEVEGCDNHEVIHSYEVRDTTNLSLIPCGKRVPPKACYTLFVTLLDKKEPVSPFLKTYNILLGSLVVSPFLFLGWSYLSKRKKLAPPLTRYPDDPEIVSIGDYRFHKKEMTLSFRETKIELSGKETDLLLLFYNNQNKTIERGEILNAVWGDDGDYIGRTLDVFISKLRKKLEADERVKIINIRGIGYKLMVK